MEISIQSLLVLIVASLDIVLGSVILAQDPKNKTNRTYALFAFMVALWGFGTGIFLFISDPVATNLLARFLYLEGSSVPASFLFFSLVFNRKDPLPQWVTLLIFLPLGIFAILYFFTDTLIAGYAVRDGVKIFEYGGLRYLFDIHLWGYFIITFFVLLKKYFQESDPREKQRILFITLGTYIVLAVAGVTNVIAPILSIFDLIWIGPVATILWICIVAYAVARHQLFNIRIIATELFVVSLLVFLAVRIFFSGNGEDFLVNILSFLIVFVLGFFLIRGVIKEVSSREQIEKLAHDLEGANARLRELDRQKSEFVSIASHQLRSPLTAIKGYASMIIEGSFGTMPEKAQEAVSRIFESSKLMTASVEDFLNVSRIEQGRMVYTKADFDLATLTKTVVDELTPAARERGLTLSFSAKGKGSFVINADLGKIKQVLSNLVDNAIKYTPQGRVDVFVERDSQKKLVRVKIEDTGVGMSAETILKLFDKFVRARNASEVNVMGSGLGLYVAKKMVEAHHGKIWVESDGEGRGSKFIVEIASAA